MIRKFLVSGLLALVVSTFSVGVAGAASLVIGGGLLTGATDVDVNGTLYDVTFINAPCNTSFNGCDDNSDFTFQTAAGSIAASQALIDQVFIGVYDTDPTLTYGITASYGRAYTPYELPGFLNGESLLSYAAYNLAGASLDVISPPSYWYVDEEIEIWDNTVLAKWSIASDVSVVPLPAALPLYGAGLAVMGFIGWRRKKSQSVA